MTLKLADKTEILQKFLKNILDNYRRRIDNVSMFMNEVLELFALLFTNRSLSTIKA